MSDQLYTLTLSHTDICSLIKSLAASDVYHKNLSLPSIDLNYVLENNERLKDILKTSLCPRPSETASAVVEGIFFTEIHVDPDVPFCEFCELAQIDLPVLYSCQCVGG
jgi:hypothetical protein